MECDDSIEDHLFEETEEADGGEEEEEEVEGDDDGEGGEEAEDDEELEEETGEELSARFKGMINLLDLFKDNSHVQLYQQFERIENEALAEKKRKALAAGQGKGSVKRPRQESTVGATSEELAEVYEYGNGRRRSRKPKKRGRRKGSRNKLSPEITKKLGDANLHYAHGRYEDMVFLGNRWVEVELGALITTCGIDWTALKKEVQAVSLLGEIIQELKEGSGNNVGFGLLDDKLMYKGCRVIPKTSSYILYLLKEYHDSMIGGNMEISKHAY